MRKLEETARRAMLEGAGENAAAYLSAEAARVVIISELKDAMFSFCPNKMKIIHSQSDLLM